MEYVQTRQWFLGQNALMLISLLLFLFGCNSVMPPIYGGIHQIERAQPGTVDAQASGSAVRRLRTTSVGTVPGSFEDMWAGGISLTPQVARRWAVPIEAQISPVGFGTPGYDLVTRIGGRFTAHCTDSDAGCTEEQRAAGSSYVAGLGGGPNMIMVEGPSGQWETSYGFNVDYEVGMVRRLDDISIHWLGRFGYSDNEATSAAIWLANTAGVGFHPSPSQVISLDARFGFGQLLESRDDKLIEFVQELGAQLTWSIRLGPSNDEQKAHSVAGK